MGVVSLCSPTVQGIPVVVDEVGFEDYHKSLMVRFHFADLGSQPRVHAIRYRDCGENADDRDDNEEFDQSKGFVARENSPGMNWACVSAGSPMELRRLVPGVRRAGAVSCMSISRCRTKVGGDTAVWLGG